MLIGKTTNKRIIVAYNSVQEAIDRESCIACVRFGEKIPCRLYRICRAEKASNEKPQMFVATITSVIEKRCTTITAEDFNGLKRSSS